MELTLIAVVVALVVGFTGGWKVNDWKETAAKVAEIKVAEAERDAAQKRADEVATRFEVKLSKIRVVNQTITNEVRHETEKTVYTDCIVPATGRSLLNRAIDSANATAGQPDGTVPAPAKGVGTKPDDDGGPAKPVGANGNSVWGVFPKTWFPGGSSKEPGK